MMREILGWSASAILVVTIVRQVYRQWQRVSSKGVSKWLFIGQMAASTGFLLYSWLIKDPVFIFTNALMMISLLQASGLCSGIVGKIRMSNAADNRGSLLHLSLGASAQKAPGQSWLPAYARAFKF
jgi:MtN3 and saliva related transmembrane protein